MIQGRGRLRFPLESRERWRILRHFVRKELQRNKPFQSGIFGLIHHAHPAATKSLQDAVVRDGLANQGVRGRHGAAMLVIVLQASQ